MQCAGRSRDERRTVGAVTAVALASRFWGLGCPKIFHEVATLLELAGGGFDGWVEVVYEGGEVVGGLRRRLDEMTEGRPLEILRVRNTRLTEQVLSPLHESETLGDLDVDEVFRRCLDLHEVPGPQRPELTRAYRETLAALAEEGWDGSAGGEGR
ncbi:MAG: hypothetical protein C3L24_13525 [Candidatus Sedimenticola endophacoides]|uniref:Nuclease SbcCD subunit D C-terminal domain-containing protein n=1 Tax=Candidatus Sedimenticola endophacoides TaxID=2548426 RepID=A0A6N4DKG1_9GAMM|nr:MAG: hypothetical protein C3L24_13525 [Candidatus Sedimenticola endophacoides]